MSAQRHPLPSLFSDAEAVNQEHEDPSSKELLTDSEPIFSPPPVVIEPISGLSAKETSPPAVQAKHPSRLPEHSTNTTVTEDASATTGSDTIITDVESRKRGNEETISSNPNREMLVAFYQQHNPDRVSDVDRVLRKYQGKENSLFRAIAKKYKVDPAVFGLTSPAFELDVSRLVPFGSNAIPFAASKDVIDLTQDDDEDDSAKATDNTIDTTTSDPKRRRTNPKSEQNEGGYRSDDTDQASNIMGIVNPRATHSVSELSFGRTSVTARSSAPMVSVNEQTAPMPLNLFVLAATAAARIDRTSRSRLQSKIEFRERLSTMLREVDDEIAKLKMQTQGRRQKQPASHATVRSVNDTGNSPTDSMAGDDVSACSDMTDVDGMNVHMLNAS
jgi:hypothetical protein